MSVAFATARGLPFPMMRNNVVIDSVARGVGDGFRGCSRIVSFEVSETVGKGI